MDEQMQLFDFQGNDVRALIIDDEPWFLSSDVVSILKYKNPRDALAKHVDKADKRSEIVKRSQLSQGRNGYMSADFINESGVYSLAFGCKLPTAKKFKHWITHDVLPSIRKYGCYIADQKLDEILHDPDQLIDLLEQAAEQLKNSDISILDKSKNHF